LRKTKRTFKILTLAGGGEGSVPAFDALVESSFFVKNKKKLILTLAGVGGGVPGPVESSSCFAKNKENIKSQL
jgi:hypothetical protein